MPNKKREKSENFVLRYKTHFDAAHHLEDTEYLQSKKCTSKHGHRWEVEVRIRAVELKGGMITDFAHIKGEIDKLDHKDLNEILSFNPTAENLAREIYKRIIEYKPEWGDWQVKITIWESPNASISYGI